MPSPNINLTKTIPKPKLYSALTLTFNLKPKIKPKPNLKTTLIWAKHLGKRDDGATRGVKKVNK